MILLMRNKRKFRAVNYWKALQICKSKWQLIDDIKCKEYRLLAYRRYVLRKLKETNFRKLNNMPIEWLACKLELFIEKVGELIKKT